MLRASALNDSHTCHQVEEAFLGDGRVFTLSVHLHEPGFFPGTGKASMVEAESGSLPYSLNVPLPVRRIGLRLNISPDIEQRGIGDRDFKRVVDTVCRQTADVYRPEAVVLQLGADGLMRYVWWTPTYRNN